MVFVIDDDPSVRRAIGRLLQSMGLNTTLLASANEFLSTDRPEINSCIILDVRLPGMSGLDLQSHLKRQGDEIPIIFMTSHGDIPMTVRAIKAGAVEFLPKPFRDQDLLDAVHLALERDRIRRRHEADLKLLRQRANTLTRREQEILPLVVAGLLNKQVAERIGASEATVKVLRSQLSRKMGARSLVDLVRIADKLGIHHATSG